MAIIHPTDYNRVVDIPADLEDMANSIQDELDLKVDKVTGKGLSTNDYTTAEKTKLSGIDTGAEVNIIENVKVNGTALTPSNKAVDVTVPTKTSDLTNDSGFGTYTKPSGGIPKTDLASAVQTSLEKADSAVQDVSGKEDKSNKVISISSSSTNTQYPGAKLVYDELKEKQDQIDALVEENSTLKKQIPTAHISTTSTQLTNSAEGLPIENVALCGATEQGENPSPDYPQTIHKVTGNCNEKVQNKNLFNKNNTSNILNAYINTSNKTVVNNANARTAFIDCKSNTTYTVSRKSGARFCVISAESAEIGTVGNVQVYDHSASNLTITTGANDKYILVFYYLSTADTLTEEEVRNSIQIEENSTATDYIAHAEQNAPLTLGDIELYDGDKIQINYVNKAGYKKVTGANKISNMGKMILDGDENFTTQTPTGFYRYGIANTGFKNDASLDTEVITYSNYFRGTTFGLRNIDVEETIFQVCNGAIASSGFNINTKKFATVEAFKTWLSTHNTTVIYQLATPTTTPITDTTLLAQLETLINLKTYKEVTHIDATGEDLTPVLEFNYYKDMTTIFDNLEARVELLEN